MKFHFGNNKTTKKNLNKIIIKMQFIYVYLVSTEGNKMVKRMLNRIKGNLNYYGQFPDVNVFSSTYPIII